MRVKKPFFRKTYVWYVNEAMNRNVKSFFWAFNQFQMNLKRRDTASTKFYLDTWNDCLNFDAEYMYTSARQAARYALEMMERLERKEDV